MIKATIGRKIFIGFFLLIILSAAFLLLSFPSLAKINILSSMVVPLGEEIGTLYDYADSVKRLENKIELYFAIRSKEAYDEALSSVKELNQIIDQSSNTGSSQRLALISDIAMQLTRATYALMGHTENQASSYEINTQIIKVNTLLSEFDDQRKNLQRHNLDILSFNVRQQKVIIDRLLDMFLIIEISIILLGFLAAFVLSKLITRSLLKLRTATRDISSGNFQSRININSKDEIGELADSFNLMADNLSRTTVSKEYVDSIIRNMAEMLVVVGSDLKIKQVNKAICRILGYQEKELIGEELGKLFVLEGQSDRNILYRRVIGSDLVDHETLYRSSQGENIPVIFSVAVMRDDEGKFAYAVCTAWDITKRKLAEEKIAEISNMKSKLTSMVSHELRTPMAAIKSGITIILDGLAGEVNEEQRDILGLIRRNVDRLARLINEVLDFQKLEAGKMTFTMQANDMSAIVRESCEAMRIVVEAKGLDFAWDCQPGILPVRCDRDKISQVVTNLINNAVKFTRQGGIKVFTASDGFMATVKVSDSGVGIKNEDRERVFYSFEQVERTIPGGTGLGLAICKEIVERHQGKIWLDSQFGQGSDFYFSIPHSK